MNYVGLDCSLSSTGLYIILDNGTEYYYNYKNNNKLSKWHKTLSHITYRDYENIKTEDYSDTEVAKIIQYNKITNMIVADILKHCKPEETKVITEGYSYSSSNTSSLLDLVCYATLLRNKLISLPFDEFIVKAPSSLKLETCQMTYDPIIKVIGGKNPREEKIYKNRIGISGGNFKKPDMIEAVFDCDYITDCYIKTALLPHRKELFKMKQIPKPIDDVIDALLLAHTEKNKNQTI